MKPEQQLRSRSVSSLHTLTILFEDPFWIGLFEKTEKLQQEENKQECKAISKEQREADKERKYELKKAKRKERHRGH